MLYLKLHGGLYKNLYEHRIYDTINLLKEKNINKFQVTIKPFDLEIQRVASASIHQSVNAVGSTHLVLMRMISTCPTSPVVNRSIRIYGTSNGGLNRNWRRN